MYDSAHGQPLPLTVPLTNYPGLAFKIAAPISVSLEEVILHCKKLKVVLTRVLGPLNSFLMSEKQVRSGMTLDFK